MTTIDNHYQTYRIPANLRLHMYRVTALGQYIIDHLAKSISVNKDIVAKINLFHDLGNVIKFDLSSDNTIVISQQEREKLAIIKAEMIAKYGKDEHQATLAIAREICEEPRVIELLSQTGVNKIAYAVDGDSWDVKIIRICDERVGPNGVVTVEARYDDLARRYAGRDHELSNATYLSNRLALVKHLEQQIQAVVDIDLQKITDDDINPYIQTLPKYEM